MQNRQDRLDAISEVTASGRILRRIRNLFSRKDTADLFWPTRHTVAAA